MKKRGKGKARESPVQCDGRQRGDSSLFRLRRLELSAKHLPFLAGPVKGCFYNQLNMMNPATAVQIMK